VARHELSRPPTGPAGRRGGPKPRYGHTRPRYWPGRPTVREFCRFDWVSFVANPWSGRRDSNPRPSPWQGGSAPWSQECNYTLQASSCQWLPPRATGCHALVPTESRREVLWSRGEAAPVRHGGKAAVQTVPGLLQARGPAGLRPGDVRHQGDASAWLANTETDLGRGTWVDPHRGQESFQHYAETWMKRTDLADSTLHANYCGVISRGVAPLFYARLCRARKWPVSGNNADLARLRAATGVVVLASGTRRSRMLGPLSFGGMLSGFF
jgi:hypothetical protein